MDVCQTRLKGEAQEEDMMQLCFTEDAPEVDLMIRTSGETRISDFLAFQARNAMLIFDKVPAAHDSYHPKIKWIILL